MIDAVLSLIAALQTRPVRCVMPAKPIIARTFPLAEIQQAHRYLESSQQIGKVVVTA